jgi:hypothetical protein
MRRLSALFGRHFPPAARPPTIALLTLTILGSLLVSSAAAGTTAKSTTRDGNRVLSQQLRLFDDGAVHYFVSADDPDGLYPYCLKLRLERKRDGRWRPLPRSRQTFKRECFRRPSQAEQQSVTKARWDLFLYPRHRLARQLGRGVLRAHGFTSLGGHVFLQR